MDYQLENLGPDRFQDVCQALLVKAFPKVQCLPLHQSDGGRDAITYAEIPGGKCIVFQAKFVEKPLSLQDPHKWLMEKLEEELPKIKTLISKGVTEYYVLTNIPGTSIPQTGSIDKTKELLRKYIPIPADCWWRNDINRRLDGEWDLKWEYPEIMSGPDLIRYILENGLSEHKERRSTAIQAFLRDQYEHDKEVRFKQVDLRNKLFDLYVDVPLSVRDRVRERKRRSNDEDVLRSVIAMIGGTTSNESANRLPTRDGGPANAATVLLHSAVQSRVPRLVIEGAPGQGKSTITQYICQVHRCRVLNESLSSSGIPTAHQNQPVRLPFRIDLRDFATWLSKKNPFSSENRDETPPQWHKSLEAFLAALVVHHSGGRTFNTDDLTAVLRISAVLLAFDGLDEVADIDSRKDVIEEVTRGLNRLAQSSVSIQAIVTSRPAAFNNSPGFSQDNFVTCELATLPRNLIDDYSAKWSQAKQLRAEEAKEVHRVLTMQLGQPHLSELAKNPMQLAILLNLIHTHGSSLPEQRTALYDQYMDLFFSREAGKSDVVRQHRNLLIAIHRYLGWILHSRAELGRHQGSITIAELTELVSDYLKQEEHEGEIVQDLFSGMLERVVALVSRVEGTFEFEVQPIREYFAARYLYDTAEYAPVGSHKSGTLPDRFAALSRNYYWLNVTRFYAGCYSSGELASLVDGLEDLAEDSEFKYTSLPLVLIATLLSDWVFAQQPKLTRRVLALLATPERLCLLCSTGARRQGTSGIPQLPPECGGRTVTEVAFAHLQNFPPRDIEDLMLELLRNHANPNDILSLWKATLTGLGGAKKLRWIEIGQRLGCLAKLTFGECDTLLKSTNSDISVLHSLLRAGHVDVCERNEDNLASLISSLLNSERGFRRRGASQPNSISDGLAQCLDGHAFAISSFEGPTGTVIENFRRFFGYREELFDPDFWKSLPQTDFLKGIAAFVLAVKSELSRSNHEWQSSLDPWKNIVNAGIKTFGNKWAFYQITNCSGLVKYQGPEIGQAFDFTSQDLCTLVQIARAKSVSPTFWKEIIEKSEGHELVFLLLLCFTWVSPGILSRLFSVLDKKLDSLDAHQWTQLYKSIEVAANLRGFWGNRSHPDREFEYQLPKTVSNRTVTLLCQKLSSSRASEMIWNKLKTYKGNDPLIQQTIMKNLSTALVSTKCKREQSYLRIVTSLYQKQSDGVEVHFRYRISEDGGPFLSIESSRKVIKNAFAFPVDLVVMAEVKCRRESMKSIVPVGTAAIAERWFVRS